MDLSWVMETIILTGIGALGFFLKSSMTEFKSSIKETNSEVSKLKDDFNSLKADLPLVYVTREDFVRSLNSIDKKLDKIYYKGGNDSCE